MMPENAAEPDPVQRFQEALAQPPTESCPHVGQLAAGDCAVRDMLSPHRLQCVRCLLADVTSAVCACCGASEVGMFFASFASPSAAVWHVGLVCRPCSGYLPGAVTTFELDQRGGVRVNRPGGAAR